MKTNYNHSILDSDLYKFTTSYAYMRKYPDASGTFQFVDRNKTVINEKQYMKILDALKEMSKLSLTSEECNWSKEHIKFIPAYYWEWLKTFHYDFSKMHIYIDEDKHLNIEVTDKLYKVTLYEVPILAIVSEILCDEQDISLNWTNIKNTLLEKIKIAQEGGFKFSEFGTRRRYSYEVQKFICEILAKYGSDVCVGTSNVKFAMMFNMTPMGTHPHEWFMFHGAQFGYKHANYMGLEAWQDVYQGDLGIALTDTYTSKVFFRNFTKVHAKLFDGIRHDSGSPYDFGENAIKRYKELGIDPLTKTIIFSDALTFPKANDLYNYFKDKIRVSFGIGTNLTNDIENCKPCNIVMKLISCKMNDNQPEYGCIKLSDVEGKHLGKLADIETAKYELGLM